MRSLGINYSAPFTISGVLIAIAIGLVAPSWSFGQTPATPTGTPSKNISLLPTTCTWNDDDNATLRLEYQQKNLEICRGLGNKKAIAGILRVVGAIHKNAGRYDEAVNALVESLSLSEATGDTPAMIRSLTGLGDVYTRKDDFSTASHFLTRALEKSEKLGDKLLLARTLRPFEMFFRKQYRSEDALRYALRRSALFTELGRAQDVKQEAIFLASLYGSIGDYPKSLEYHQKVLANEQEVGDERWIANALSNIGSLYYGQGFFEQALEYFQRSFEMSKKIENARGMTSAAESLQAVYTSIGDAARAAKYTRIALDYYLNELRNARDERAKAYSLQEIGRKYKALGDIEQAREYFEKTLAFTSTTTDKNWNTFAIEQLARLEQGVGNEERAIGLYERSLTSCEEPNAYEIELILRCVRIRTYLAERHQLRGQEERAMDMVEKAERLSLKHDANDWISHTNNLLVGKAYYALSQYEKARSALEKSISANERDADRFLGDTDRLKFLSSMRDVYEVYLDVLMSLHRQQPTSDHSVNAFNLIERTRSRMLFDLLTEKNLIIREGVDTELLERERVIQRKLNALVGRQSRNQQDLASEQAAALQREIPVLLAEYEQVRSILRTKSPRYTNLSRPTALTAKQIQRDLLENDTILLEYSLGEKKSYLWSVTRDSVRSYDLPTRQEIDIVARRVYHLLQDGKPWASEDTIDAEYANAAGKLSEMLLGPVAEQIKGKRLVIVADGAIQYVPFSALPSPGFNSIAQAPMSDKVVPLAVTNEIVSLPSASVLAVLRREATSRKTKRDGVAVLADPVFADTDERLKNNGSSSKPENKSDFNRLVLKRAFRTITEETQAFAIPRLPFTRREADAIFDSAPKNTSLKAVDFDADREKLLKADLSRYRMVHFATHGILHSEHPDLSGIVLSLVNEKGEPVNGFLRLNEIYNMNLNADLVVLSACQTALGKEVRGEGLIGLTRGFMYAGSPRVVASLWKVDDVATAELMKLFYQKMLQEKMRPAAALRAAKVAMYKTKRWNAPYYWAAFELQGEWR